MDSIMTPAHRPGAITHEQAEQLYRAAVDSLAIRTSEADLRSDLFLFLGPFAHDVLGLPAQSVRQEGTSRSGRFDSMFGRAVIEYKRPRLLDSSTEREHAATQSLGYLEDETLGAQVVIVTDGKTWGFLRDVDAGPEPGEQGWLFADGDALTSRPADRFSWQINTPNTALRVLTLLSTLTSAPVTTTSVTARLGPDRPEVVGILRLLAWRLTTRERDDRTDTLFRQWIALAGVAYGIAHSSSPFPSPGEEELLGQRLARPLAGTGYAGSLFVLHTYVSLAAKLLACELLSLRAARQDDRPTQWVALPAAGLASKLADLERGAITESLGAPDMLDSDLFGWWVPLLQDNPELTNAVRELILSMSELAWARVANAGGIAVDLLRSLYQAIVPRLLRKALGEFFTPRWLAERVLTKALDLAEPLPPDRPVRILDPSCGSGTFLVAALRYGLARLAVDGQAENPEQIEALVDSTIGFDVNPVAPLMTRVNLLLALGDRAQQLPEVRFRVYQADSLLLPEPRFGAVRLEEPSEAHVLPLEIGDILIPDALATLAGVSVLRGQIEDGIAQHRSRDVFVARLHSEIVQVMPSVAGQHLEAALEGAAAIYDILADLARQRRNGVWSRIIEQSFAPCALGEVDVVVGNPPWVSWKALPDRWKVRSEATWRRWGLWQTAGRSVPLSDVSTLLLARSVATYAPHGVVAFLLPLSVLIADPSGTRVRQGRLRPALGDRSGIDDDVAFRPLHVDIFATLNPFMPDASNEPVAVYLRSGEALTPNTVPWSAQRWERRVSRSRLTPTESWAAIANEKLEYHEERMAPIDATDPGSPWAREADRSEVRLLTQHDRSHYAWGRGFETRGVDGILFVEVISSAPAGRRGLVTIRSRPDLGKNTRELPSQTLTVEPILLWPLIKGADVRPWSVSASDLYVIVAHDPLHNYRVLSERDLIARSPQLFDYLERHIERLRGRSLYRATAHTPDGPWGLSGPLHRIDPTAHVVLVRYIASGGRPGAAVSSPVIDGRLGRETSALPNNKTNIHYTKDINEAHYLAGWINSYSVQAALERYSAATGITPAALERLAIPPYDQEQPQHRAVAQAAQECQAAATRGSAPGLATCWAKVDRAVASLASVPLSAIPSRSAHEVLAETLGVAFDVGE